MTKSLRPSLAKQRKLRDRIARVMGYKDHNDAVKHLKATNKETYEDKTINL